MLRRFESFVTGITVCYKYIQRIKSMEMGELGLKGAHAMCLFYLHHNPGGLTAAQLCTLCAEDKAAISRTVADLRRHGLAVRSRGRTTVPPCCSPSRDAPWHSGWIISSRAGSAPVVTG